MKQVPQYWSPVLQALAHWIAYKKQYYHGHLLSEGAIVAELTQLLSAKIDTNFKIQCERMYKDFVRSLNDQTRVDIVIGDKLKVTTKGKLKVDGLTDIIEVKRYEGQFSKIEDDFEKLAVLKDACSEARLFQVIVGQHILPDKLFTDNHNVKTGNVYKRDKPIEARPRMGKRAYNTKKDSKYGVFAVLIEII